MRNKEKSKMENIECCKNRNRLLLNLWDDSVTKI